MQSYFSVIVLSFSLIIMQGSTTRGQAGIWRRYIMLWKAPAISLKIRAGAGWNLIPKGDACGILIKILCPAIFHNSETGD
jgi:hypothetical protein